MQNYPLSIVVKVECGGDHNLTNMARQLDLYEREYNFYAGLQPDFPLSTPKSYGMLFTKDFSKREGVILEDLGDFVMYTGSERSIIQNCANLHAKYWGKERLLHAKLCNDNMALYPRLGTFMRSHYEAFVMRWSSHLRQKDVELALKIADRFELIQDYLSRPPLTLCHGDVKRPNIHMDLNGMPVFIDWQHMMWGKGVQDIVFLLIESSDVDSVDSGEWKTMYMECLHASDPCTTIYTKEQLDKDWAVAMCFYPVFVCFWLGTIPDQEHIDNTFAQRFIGRTFAHLSKVEVDQILDSLDTN